jgi:hypothetical protein
MTVIDKEQTGASPTDIPDLDVSVKDRKLFHSFQYTCLASRFIDKAFAAKHLPDLGYDVKGFRVFTWRLTGWKKLEKKLTSPEFECGGHKWWCTLLLHLRMAIFTYRKAYPSVPFREFESS